MKKLKLYLETSVWSYYYSKDLQCSSHTDAIHVAAASVYNLDALISWNCRHLANLNRKSRINAINIQNNYKPIDIITPMEVMYYKGR
jgi:hypothetical protein